MFTLQATPCWLGGSADIGVQGGQLHGSLWPLALPLPSVDQYRTLRTKRLVTCNWLVKEGCDAGVLKGANRRRSGNSSKAAHSARWQFITSPR